MTELQLTPPANAAMQEEGVRRIQWVQQHMGVLSRIRERFEQEKPFAGMRVGMALHVEAKTCALALTLQAGGADVRLAGCNPDSTDDRVVLAMNETFGIPTMAKKGQNREEYYASLHWILDHKPHLVIDDGGDLGFLAHTERTDALEHLIAGAEETTTGVIRFQAMADEGALKIPMLNVNDAKMKHMFDNRYGTGQSTLDGIMYATNLVIASKETVVVGYGWCGRGIATRAKGMGASVIVCEVDPVRAIEARMDGYRVMPLAKALPEADLVITATGCVDILTAEHVPLLKDKVILANSGHFDNEISKPALEAASNGPKLVREGVHAYELQDGRTVYLLSEGRLVNLASGQGHPAEIMDTSFAVQALGLERMAKEGKTLVPGVYEVSAEMDDEIAREKLASLGIEIDALTDAQRTYLSTWQHGT